MVASDLPNRVPLISNNFIVTNKSSHTEAGVGQNSEATLSPTQSKMVLKIIYQSA